MVSDKETADNYVNLMKNHTTPDGTPITDTRAYPGFDVLLPTNAGQKYSGSEKFGAMGLGFLIAGPIGAGVGAVLTGGSKDNYVNKNVMFSDEGLILVDNKNTSSVLLFPWSEFRGLNFHNSVWGPRACSIELYLNDNNVINMKFYSPTIDEFPELFANECQKMISTRRVSHFEENVTENQTIETTNTKWHPQDELFNDETENSKFHKLNDKGVELHCSGRYEEALVYYDKALSVEPNNEICLLNKAKVLGFLDMDEERVFYCDKALYINPNNEEILLEKGFALNSLEKYEEAIKFFDKVLSINPNNKEASDGRLIGENILEFSNIRGNDLQELVELVNKGNELSKLGEYEEAIKYYDKGLKIESNNETILKGKAVTFNNWGLSLYNNKNYDGALDCYNKSLELRPDDKTTLRNKASVFNSIGVKLSNNDSYDKAIEYYDNALSITPNDVTILNNKEDALRYKKRKEENEGKKWYQKIW